METFSVEQDQGFQLNQLLQEIRPEKFLCGELLTILNTSKFYFSVIVISS